MKKLLIISIGLILLVSCGPSRAELESSARQRGITVDSVIAEFHGHSHARHDYSDDVKTATVDGCQYLIYDSSIIHKANCNNPIHQPSN